MNLGPQPIHVVPEDHVDPTKIMAAFVAVTAWAPIYKYYIGSRMSEKFRQCLFPMVLLLNRWDGRIGFPGGKAEGLETPRTTAMRETWEEIRMRTFPSSLIHVLSHTTPKIVGHLYMHQLEEASNMDLKHIIWDAAISPAVLCEGVPFWAHLADYGDHAGWDTLRASTGLATAVPEELDVIREIMFRNPPPGAYPGPVEGMLTV